MKPNLFEYGDYRKYLRDCYAEFKKSRPAFSFRFFAREAGFASPNFLKLVMEGQRNLSAESIPKFAKALKLGRQEADFFESLVHFNQAGTAGEKTKFYERMTHNRRYREIRGLEKDQFRFYSKWYYSAIRELVTLSAFREDSAWIARALEPEITERQAREGLELLLKLRLLERTPDGRLKQVDPTITSGAEVQSVAVTNFHREMLQRALEAIESAASSERDVSSVTLGVPQGRIAELKEKVARFRRELLVSIGAASEATDRVYQLNVQLFPLSKKGGGQ